MNYKNGREIKAGDYAIGPLEGQIVAGKIHECTGKAVILYPVQGRTIFAPIEAADFFHAEDAHDASKELPEIEEGLKQQTERLFELHRQLNQKAPPSAAVVAPPGIFPNVTAPPTADTNPSPTTT